MGKQRRKILVIGEGITEFYYFNSLKDVLKGIDVKPEYPKHTNMQELERKIQDGIFMGYDAIFCVIDMDNKNQTGEGQKYSKLKERYADPIVKPKKGINCTVKFFETHLCTELFFLYYYEYTSKYYESQPQLLDDLKKHYPDYKKGRTLHSDFEKMGGRLVSAVKNSIQSMAERKLTGREYTYSELGQMLIDLGYVQED